MAVPGGRRNGEEDDGANLFDDDGLALDFAEEEHDVDHDDVPFHLRALLSASESGDSNALRQALDNYDGYIDDIVEDGDTLLHLACLYGHLDCVQLLLDRGANMEATDVDGGIPLHDASAGGHTDIVRLLFSRANDPERIKRMVDAVDADGDTPLHHAALGEHVEIILLLLEHGASPNKTNLYGKTPVDLADVGGDARRILNQAAMTSNNTVS